MKSITCPKCGMTSHNRHDVEEGWCGRCCAWTHGEVKDVPELDHDLIKRVGQQWRDARTRWLLRRGVAFCVAMGLVCYVGFYLFTKWFSVGLLGGSISTALMFLWLQGQMKQ